jgi:hypothetical protein
MGEKVIFFAQTDSSSLRLILINNCNSSTQGTKNCLSWGKVKPAFDSMQTIYKKYTINLEKINRIYNVMESLKLDGFTSEFSFHGLPLRLYKNGYVINYFPDSTKANNHYKQALSQQPLITKDWYLEKRLRE